MGAGGGGRGTRGCQTRVRRCNTLTVAFEHARSGDLTEDEWTSFIIADEDDLLVTSSNMEASADPDAEKST